MIKNKKRAFSLIELMVVIAIVAVLAAIAVPAYKNYILKARVASAMQVVGTIVDSSIEGFATRSTFANAQQAGLPLVGGDPNVGDISGLSPYLSTVTMSDNGTGRACRGGAVLTQFNTGPLGDSSITDIQVYNYIFEIDGIVTPFCLYVYVIDDSFNGSDDIIGNCVNMFSEADQAAEIQQIIDDCA